MSDYEVLADDGNFRICASPDSDVPNPRKEYDHLGTMVYSYRGYILGDEEAKHTEDYYSWTGWLEHEVIAPDGSWELPDNMLPLDEDGGYADDEYDVAYEAYRKTIVSERLNDIVFFPLYVYEHSGITMGVGNGYPFNDLFDAGQVGWIYAWKNDALRCGFTEENWRTMTEQTLLAEVHEFDNWLTGSYVCLQLQENFGGEWETIDSICCIPYDDIKSAVLLYFGEEYKELAEAI